MATHLKIAKSRVQTNSPSEFLDYLAKDQGVTLEEIRRVLGFTPGTFDRVYLEEKLNPCHIVRLKEASNWKRGHCKLWTAKASEWAAYIAKIQDDTGWSTHQLARKAKIHYTTVTGWQRQEAGTSAPIRDRVKGIYQDWKEAHPKTATKPDTPRLDFLPHGAESVVEGVINRRLTAAPVKPVYSVRGERSMTDLTIRICVISATVTLVLTLIVLGVLGYVAVR